MEIRVKMKRVVLLLIIILVACGNARTGDIAPGEGREVLLDDTHYKNTPIEGRYIVDDTRYEKPPKFPNTIESNYLWFLSLMTQSQSRYNAEHLKLGKLQLPLLDEYLVSGYLSTLKSSNKTANSEVLDNNIKAFLRVVSIPNAKIYCSVFDRNDAKIIYAGTDKGLFVTKDFGYTWMSFDHKDIKDRLISKIYTDVENNLYLLAHYGELPRVKEIFKVFNKTKEVKLIYHIDDNVDELITNFKVYEKDANFMLLSLHLNQNLLLSKDAGRNWEKIHNFKDDPLLVSEFIEFGFNDPNIIYFEEGFGPNRGGEDRSRIFESKDQGKHWKIILEKKEGDGRVSALSSIPDSNEIIVAIRSRRNWEINQIFKSNENTYLAGQWNTYNLNVDIKARIYDLNIWDDKNIIAHSYTQIVRSKDGGKTWQCIDLGLKEDSYISELAVSRINQDYVSFIAYMHSDSPRMYLLEPKFTKIQIE